MQSTATSCHPFFSLHRFLCSVFLYSSLPFSLVLPLINLISFPHLCLSLQFFFFLLCIIFLSSSFPSSLSFYWFVFLSSSLTFFPVFIALFSFPKLFPSLRFFLLALFTFSHLLFSLFYPIHSFSPLIFIFFSEFLLIKTFLRIEKLNSSQSAALSSCGFRLLFSSVLYLLLTWLTCFPPSALHRLR